MKLYVTPFAPNALRVQIFMLEKDVDAAVVDVSAVQGGEYLKFNPLGQVPALETNSGELITESLTICQYLDAISGEPYLFGSTIEDRARIGMWERRAELLLFNPSIEYGHHTHPMFAGRIVQHDDWAKSLVPKALRMIDVMGDQLDKTAYLAGEDVSAADLTAILGYYALIAYGALPASTRPSIQAWAADMLARPSMAPLHQAAAFLQSTLAPAKEGV